MTESAADTTSSMTGIFSIHIVFSCSVIHNLHRFSLFEQPSKITPENPERVLDCSLTKVDGILQDMHCSWPKTEWFNGILGQIQINAKLEIDRSFYVEPYGLRSQHPIHSAIKTVVDDILNTALSTPPSAIKTDDIFDIDDTDDIFDR